MNKTGDGVEARERNHMVFIKTKCFGQFLGNLKSREMDLHHPYDAPIRKYTVGFLQAAEGKSKSVL